MRDRLLDAERARQAKKRLSWPHNISHCGSPGLGLFPSLGMVVQGHDSTVPVSLDEMAYHTQCFARGNRNAWIVSDLPYGSYHESTGQAQRA